MERQITVVDGGGVFTDLENLTNYNNIRAAYDEI